MFLAAIATPALAAPAGYAPQLVMLGPVPLEFILFALTLLGVALFHHKTLQVALTGLVVITLYKLAVRRASRTGPGFAGLAPTSATSG